MSEALKQAQYAFEEGEIPVGAVIVSKNRVIAKGYNQTEKLNDVTAHAEMLAITSAANYLGAKYLIDCRLYVTFLVSNWRGSLRCFRSKKRIYEKRISNTSPKDEDFRRNACPRSRTALEFIFQKT
jgi:hypothetical protein